FQQREDVGGAVALVLRILSGHGPGPHRQLRLHLAEQLARALVETDHRTLGIIGALVDVQHILHGADEGGVLLGRNAPLAFAMGGELVFFSTPGAGSRARWWAARGVRRVWRPEGAASSGRDRLEAGRRPTQSDAPRPVHRRAGAFAGAWALVKAPPQVRP